MIDLARVILTRTIRRMCSSFLVLSSVLNTPSGQHLVLGLAALAWAQLDCKNMEIKFYSLMMGINRIFMLTQNSIHFSDTALSF